MDKFSNIEVKDFQINPFKIKNEWMLISAEIDGKANTMTASWGSFGVMWNKNVVSIVIRPQRFTREFVDNAELFSLCFFDKEHLNDLSYLGKVSGRDEDKIAKTVLTLKSVNNTPYFDEAKTIIFAKKLYIQRMDEQFLLDKSIDSRWYPEHDYHYLYIAEITNIYTKKTRNKCNI